MSDEQVLARLYATIMSRRSADPETSWTAKLFAQGRAKIVQKVGEEAMEMNIAALTEGPDELAAESADLLYHMLVLWAQLAKREGQSGIEEKRARGEL